MHLRHLRRLWALPTVTDQLQSSVDELTVAVPAQHGQLRTDMEGYYGCTQEQFTLMLRRFAALENRVDSLVAGIDSRVVAKSVDPNDSVVQIVGVPFVYQSLADVPRGARVLIVGADGSAMSRGLASLGYRVKALDVCDVIRSPGSTRSESVIVDDKASPAPFDAAVVVSTTAWASATALDGDARNGDSLVQVWQGVRRLLVPSGRLVMTTLVGRTGGPDGQERIPLTSIDTILQSIRVTSCATAIPAEESRWVTRWGLGREDLRNLPDREVVLLIAGLVLEAS